MKREDIDPRAIYRVMHKTTLAKHYYYGNSLLDDCMAGILTNDDFLIEKVNKHEEWASELENGVRKPQKG